MENNLPAELVEQMTSSLGNEMERSGFNQIRDSVWNEIIDRFYEENREEVFVKGKVTKINAYKNGARTMELTERGNKIIVYCPGKKELKNNIELGTEVSVKGHFSIYKNQMMSDGKLQIQATEVKNLGREKWDIKPFKKYIKKNKKTKKLRFWRRQRVRIALITSKNSEARKDILNVVGRFYEVEEHFVNLYNPKEIAAKISVLNDSEYDVILISRGGMERLEVFNSYPILNEIYKSEKITMTALGHANFSSLSDIVADYAYNTPSAAAYELNRLRSRYIEKRNTLVAFVIVIGALLSASYYFSNL